MRVAGRLLVPGVSAAHRHQEGVMDVALAIGLHLEDSPRRGKLRGCGSKLGQGLVSR